MAARSDAFRIPDDLWNVGFGFSIYGVLRCVLQKVDLQPRRRKEIRGVKATAKVRG